jgi:hypothetical protein
MSQEQTCSALAYYDRLLPRSRLRLGETGEEARGALVDYREAVATALVAEGAGDPALARAGRRDYGEVRVLSGPSLVARGHCYIRGSLGYKGACSAPSTTAIGSLRPSSGHTVWLYPRSPSASVMSRACSRNAISISPMKRSVGGSASSDRCLPESFGSGNHVRLVAGTWTKWSCGSQASSIGSGGRLTMKVEVLDILVQTRRDKAAALRLLRNSSELCTGDHHHRQARVLWRRHTPAPSFGLPRPGAASEQPGRELAPADTPSRTEDAPVQIAWIGPAISVGPCDCPQHLQHPAPPCLPQNPEGFPGGGDGELAASDHGLCMTQCVTSAHPRP